MGDDLGLFRAHQSMCAEAHASFGVRLVEFDAALYFGWLNGRGYKDNAQFRAQWAAISLDKK
jgi:hypothetical protein